MGVIILKNYTLIRDGVVENICVSEPENISLIADDWDHIEDISKPEWSALGIGIGWTWDGMQFFAPPTPPAPAPIAPEWEWFIDIGPFYDRFGGTKMAVLTSGDAGLKAILSDLNIRKWVDLKRVDVAQALAYVGSVVPAVTPALQGTILNTPVSPIENLALRRLYFNA